MIIYATDFIVESAFCAFFFNLVESSCSLLLIHLILHLCDTNIVRQKSSTWTEKLSEVSLIQRTLPKTNKKPSCRQDSRPYCQKFQASRDLGRPLLGEISVRLLVLLHTKLCSKFEVSSSSSFGDMFDRMPKILGVT